MKKAVILGAGLATRLYPMTHHLPKVLVNYKQHTILKNLHDIYTDLGADEIIVVIHSKFAATVEAYAKQENLNITIRTVDEAYGSAYALALLSEDLHSHNVLLNWCDIIPDFGGFKWHANTIYVKGNECRYDFDGEVISNVGSTGGNVVGIYQVADWEFDFGTTKEEIHRWTKEKDFIEFLRGQSFEYSELANLIDLGDKPKLITAHSKGEINRSFNSIEILDDTVIKHAVNAQGQALQRDELDWYAKVESDSVPKIVAVDTNSFEMDRIVGVTAYEWLKNVPRDSQIKYVKNILDALNFSEETICSHDLYKEDFKKEIITKVLDRCKSIQPLIDSFGKVEYVNDVKIGRLKTLLTQAYNHLTHYHEFAVDEYTVIHGDPNFSNTMMTIGGDVKFIDPRGYFGNTKIYGPRTYDEAKVLYAISGYDSFNSQPDWGGLVINGTRAYVSNDSLIQDYTELEMFDDHHHLWVAIIWIALGGYFKNNPLKAVSAYYYGMYLLSKQLNKMGRLLEDGSISKDGPVVQATLITKNPGKWILLDKETGVQYRPIGGDIKHQWERI
ncbi:hypothetical protein YenMTG1_054 [Yersinia phage vB_YenM_TG1]|uniref:Nucleotidyl transferase domain-containing protein n=1 Tax=Yersinia phage vB_YenM_TG1 TaxID=1589265 RepID=A0A0B4ZX23_9CAUD|nr:hypothetical protein AVV33_gp054 [Yersinia phage vB_YenM_TG1]AJD81862.1 hypothetical protein YenMTG1_054 [Yersinia phage vB_YenM_TG1]